MDPSTATSGDLPEQKINSEILVASISVQNSFDGFIVGISSQTEDSKGCHPA